MKKQNSRRLLLVFVALIAAAGLVAFSAVASVLAYRQFVREERPGLTAALEGLQVEERQVAEGQGVVILKVEPGSPAEQAGLRPGILIVSVNGRDVNNPRELKEIISGYEAGDSITLTVKDGDKSEDVVVTLAEAGPYLGVNVGPGGRVFGFRPEESGEAPYSFGVPHNFGSPDALPFEFRLDQFGFDQFHFDEFDFEHAPHFERLLEPGALVTSVLEDSPASEAGLQVGDAISEIDGQPVENGQDLIDTVADLSPGDEVTLSVQRGEETLSVDITLSKHPDDEERAYLGVFLAPSLLHRNMDFFQEQSGG